MFARKFVSLFVFLGLASSAMAEPPSSVGGGPVQLSVALPTSSVFKFPGTQTYQAFLFVLQEKSKELGYDFKKHYTIKHIDTKVDKDHAMK